MCLYLNESVWWESVDLDLLQLTLTYLFVDYIDLYVDRTVFI